MKSNLIEKKDRIRPDGLSKVTGDLKYLTDLTFPNMLYGKVLRSKYPHAKIACGDFQKFNHHPFGVAVHAGNETAGP